MSVARLIAWVMLGIWAAWISALHGSLVAKTPLGPWSPDLGLLLLVACAAGLEKRDVPLATLIVACGRLAYTVEPPEAILAAFLGVSVLCQWVRRLVELENLGLRMCLCGGGAFLTGLWLALVHASRSASVGASTGLDSWRHAFGPSFATGITTGLCGLVLVGAFAHLPGLSPLRRPRW